MTRTTKQVLDQDYEHHVVGAFCTGDHCCASVHYVHRKTRKGYCPGCATIRASEAADAPREDTVGNGQPSEG